MYDMVAYLIVFVIVFALLPVIISWHAMYDAYKCVPEFNSYSRLELLWTSLVDTVKNITKLN